MLIENSNVTALSCRQWNNGIWQASSQEWCMQHNFFNRCTCKQLPTASSPRCATARSSTSRVWKSNRSILTHYQSWHCNGAIYGAFVKQHRLIVKLLSRWNMQRSINTVPRKDRVYVTAEQECKPLQIQCCTILYYHLPTLPAAKASMAAMLQYFLRSFE